MPDAKAEWGVLASEAEVTSLSSKRRMDLWQLILPKLRRAKQKAQIPRDGRTPFSLQRNDAKSSGDGGSDSAGKSARHLILYPNTIMSNV